MLDDVAFALVAAPPVYSRTQFKQHPLAYDAPADFAALFFGKRSLVRLTAVAQRLAAHLILLLSSVRKKVTNATPCERASTGPFFHPVNTRIAKMTRDNINVTHLAFS